MPKFPPVVLGDAGLAVSVNDCGCCVGIDVNTPQAHFNLPELNSIHYRVGTHGQFLESMLARLSSSKLPALTSLRTRDTDDVTIALLDGWATIADILTFYQERIANESYLRTATERHSIIELAKLIGYQPHPGVSAGTYLAFFLAEALGTPEQAIQRTTIPRGTRVQSVPGPGETPQTFETVEELEARLDWNRLRPRMTQPQVLTKQSTEAFLKGTDTGLNKGDALLFVGEARETKPLSDAWDLRFVTAVEPDHANGRTRIEWVFNGEAEELRSVTNGGPNPTLYTLRLRASLFGHNAIDPRLLHPDIREQLGLPPLPSNQNSDNDGGNLPLAGELEPDPVSDWPFEIGGNTLELDAVYSDLLANSWLVLSRRADLSEMRLYRVIKVYEQSRTNYAMSGRITAALLDSGNDLNSFEKLEYRPTAVYMGTKKVELSEAPLSSEIHGDRFLLDRDVPHLMPAHRLLIRGRIASPANASPGHSVGTLISTMVAPGLFGGTVLPKSLAGNLTAVLPIGEGGGDGDEAEATPPISPAGEIRTELVRMERVESEAGLTKLVFEKSLANRYVRASVEVFGNVASANHGETVNEILGSGAASQSNQRFTLKQKPLTYVSAINARGAASTLKVWVNDVLWKEVPSLHEQGGTDRVYTTETDDEGKVTLLFGDGINGARLPTGQNNVRAHYRKGIGLGGNVDDGQISLLMSRPLGVDKVTNPLPATGAADPEARDDARTNAPITVLTLDRVVSLQDYENFARSFAGVAKALATWSWAGGQRRVCLTVAGPEGALIPEGGDVHRNLVHALRRAGDPFVSVLVKSFQPVTFRTAMTARIRPAYESKLVLDKVEEALRSTFGFAARSLGQPVHRGHVIAAVEAVEGVEAVDVDRLHRTTAPNASAKLYPRLPARSPSVGSHGDFQGAELLTLDPGPITLGVMS